MFAATLKQGVKLAFLTAMAVTLAGCAGYRLGPTNGAEAGARSIEVKPFVNNTMEPRLGEPITQAMRKSLQQDGTYRLATGGGADVVLTGEIMEFSRSPISFQSADLMSVQDYSLSVSAKIKAVDRVSGKVLLEREVYGRSTIRVGSDLTSAERQAAPLMAEDLARRATMYLVDGKW